jgi:hypothetical protein
VRYKSFRQGRDCILQQQRAQIQHNDFKAMVHVCHTVQEIVDPSTQAVDTLVVIGTVTSFQNDVSFVTTEILPVALTVNTMKNDPTVEPAAKKAKQSSSEAAVAAAVEQGRFIVTSVLKNLLGTMNPSKDVPVSTEVWVPRSSYVDSTTGSQSSSSSSSSSSQAGDYIQQSSPLLVVLIVLPSTATLSRHNAPGQPSNITSMLKKHVRLTESTAIVPLLERPEDARSVVCAIARVSGGLLYNRKTATATDSSTLQPDDDGSNGVYRRHVLRQPGPLVLPAGGGTFIHETALPSLNHLRVLLGHPTRVIPMTTTLQQELATLALGIQLTRRLVDAPCSELHTTAFKEQALAVCQDLTNALQANGAGTVTTKVIEGEDLDKQGFGGLYGVGKAGRYHME